MSSDVVVKAAGLSKCYHLYDRRSDRLKQMLFRGRKSFYREFWALRDISFEVKRGESVALVGRNGSGKSTLLQLICGTLNPTSGSVATSGRVAALLELGSGFNPDFTGRENVFLNGAIIGLSRQEMTDRYQDIVSFADIGDFLDQPVKTYSSGMLVRLAFSVAINSNPELLIVDEALGVGDELFQRKCYSRIAELQQDGVTLLFVSHSPAAVVELCDRALLLDAGELLLDDEPKNTVAQYQRLIYAPAASREALRSQIRMETGSKSSISSSTSPEESAAEERRLTQPSFDPALISQSCIEFEDRGVRIENPCIQTLQGKQVNNLVRGETYNFCYDAVFASSAERVRFGMLIKTTIGFPLGGALSSADSSEIPRVESGGRASIRFAFECRLNAGVYFLNAGVFGSAGAEETVLYRIVDAVVFRVIPIEHNLLTESVDFAFNPQVSLS